MRRTVSFPLLAFLALSTLPAHTAKTAPPVAWKPARGPLMTRWAKNVSPANALPEYPRPQMVRHEWRSLNGLWRFSATPTGGQKFAGRILVPYPIESALSGVMRHTDRLRYERTFDVPSAWRGQRVLLHFGAVDWQAAVSVNGKRLGTHRGGYDPFTFDITDALKASGPQTLAVDVFDPTDTGEQPRGKQSIHPQGIFYTPTTGIWQSVWLEPVPFHAIDNLRLIPDLPGKALRLLVGIRNPGATAGYTVRATALDGSTVAGRAAGPWGTEIRIPLRNVKTWSPAKPFLYGLRVELLAGTRVADAVDSYFGMRSIGLKRIGGVNRIVLNGQPLFLVGPLDQGFWPDGIYTAPTDAALKFDIQVTRDLGFNMARKHVKVEPERWYYWADRLGLVVWQDMPSGDNRTPEGKREFESELRRMVAARRTHPSIVTWVVFNEGWGQFDTQRLTAMVKKMDPSRLVDDASGWTDMGVGDMRDVHAYPAPAVQDPGPNRASIVGEFGGLPRSVPGHMWSSQAFGYTGLLSREELTRRYEDLYRIVARLKRENGISAVVYTQTTDVEGEANGLLTYDRAIMKMDPARVRRANALNLPPAPTPITVVPTSQKEPQTWRYTFERPAGRWMAPDFDDSGWKEGAGGFGTEGTPGSVVRTVWNTPNIWLRRTFTLPDPLPKDLALLVHHDENVRVFLNGVPATRASGFTTDYEVMPIEPAALAALHPGTNTIAVSCRQTSGGQYIDAGLVRIPAK